MSRRVWLAYGIFGLAVSAGLVAGEARAQAPCPLPDDPAVILDFLWPLVDTNGDGGLSLQEAQAIYPELDAFYFSLVDSDRNGRITKNELLVLLPLLGGDFLALIDTNGDRVITYSEVSDYVTPAQFAQLDTNGDGRIDCRDLEGDAGEGEGGPEGEVGTDPEGEWPDLAEYCQYLPLVVQYFPTLDTNNSGGISRSELMPVVLIVPDYDIDAGFALLDLDNNGEITLAEINHVAATVCGGGAEGEGEGGGGLPSDLDEICQYLPLVPALFPSMDLDGSGGISVSELNAALAMFGLSLDPGEITLVYAIADTNNDGEISLAEFDAVAQVACGAGGGGGEGEPEGEGEGGGGLPVDLDEICQYLPLVPVLFPSFDTDGSGGISASELIAALAGLGVSLDPGEIALVYAIADTNNDGEISLAEFDAVAQVACGPGGGGGGEGEVEGDPEGEPVDFDLADLCQYLPLVDSLFDAVDQDNSGGISLAELMMMPVPMVLPTIDIVAAFAVLDADGDGEVTRAEIAAAAAVICDGEAPEGETDPEGEPGGEGEVEGEPGGGDILALLCGQLPLIEALFPMADTNGDGRITLSEVHVALSSVGVLVSDVAEIFAALDADNDGGVTLAEIRAAHAAYCGDAVGEAELALALTRSAGLNNRYVAGETLRVTATISGSGAGALSALGLAETLPEGWTLAEVVDAAGAESAPEAGATGTIEFAWLEIPALPVTVVYDVAVPADASGATVIVGEVLYRVGESGEITTGSQATLLLSADAMPAPHSADFNGDGRVNLSEVLRVIQLYNLAEFHCDDATEDGYAPGAGPRVCAPHASDYNPQDWKVSLSELLRMIQLYNVHGGYYHANPETEDGYAPGLAA